MTVSEAVEHCTRLTRAHSSTFYLGSRLFPGDKRQAVSVIYAVCRSGDDAVDETADPVEARRALRQWWGAIDRAYAGRPDPDSPLEVGLASVLERYDVPVHAFEELYLGLCSDLEPQRIASLDELMLYCRRVAGVVGWLIAPIAGYRGGAETLDQAMALGQAMQLTNILRDVGEDLGRGRCYLPQERLDRHGVTLDDLHLGLVTPGYVALLEELADRTHRLYRRGWQGIPRLHGVTATAVGVAALNYEGILRKLRQNGWDNLTRRAYLRTYERIALIPRAVVGVYTNLT